MKKLFGVLSAALAAAMVLAVPASAAAILTGDSFTSATKLAAWEPDRYDADEFDAADGSLYLTLGRKGFTSARPADKKDKYYALQGRKLAVAKPTSNTWTATVKLNLDDAWFASGGGSKRAVFRVDLADAEGNPFASAPAIAIVKTSTFPTVNIATSKSKTGWLAPKTYIDGDKEIATLDIDMGWHQLVVNCNKGLITYYLDEKKIGSFPVTEKGLYPTHLALNAQNFDRADTIEWDNCYLYDGNVLLRQRTTNQQNEYEDNMAEKYEKKRNRWEDSHTEYRFARGDAKAPDDIDLTYDGKTVTVEKGKWYKQSSLKSKLGISMKDWDDETRALREVIRDCEYDYDKREDDMPDSYWDY